MIVITNRDFTKHRKRDTHSLKDGFNETGRKSSGFFCCRVRKCPMERR